MDEEYEARDNRRAARAFLRALRSGDGYRVLAAATELSETVDGWSLAIREIARLQHVSPEVQRAFIDVWVESKGLGGKFEKPSAWVPSLRVLFPPHQVNTSLIIYRGAHWIEHTERNYGLSWTTSPESAEEFARDKDQKVRGGEWYEAMRGVVLKAAIPPAGILLKREKEGYYDEEEVVVDPDCLVDVTLVSERLESGLLLASVK